MSWKSERSFVAWSSMPPRRWRYCATKLGTQPAASTATTSTIRSRIPRSITISLSSPADLVHERRAAQQLDLAGEALAQPFGHADRGIVPGPDEADHAVAGEGPEGVGEAGLRGLGCVAAAPVPARQRPSQLEAGPSGRIEEAHAAGELA